MFEKFGDVLTISDTCIALKLGRNTVYRLIHNGTIKSIKIGKKYIVPKIYIIDYINAHR